MTREVCGTLAAMNRKMKRRKITLLDLGGVVFQSTGTSNDKINWKIISSLNNKYGYELNIGKNRFTDFLTEYNKLSNQDLTREEFLKEVFDTLEMNKELIEIVKEKSDIVIVSDNYRENIEYISKRYNFKDWSIKQIYSFDYQMVKSNPNFFEKLIKELKGYKIEEMIYIDDSISKIESAKRSGIKGIQYQNNEQIRVELKEHSR